MDLGCAFNNSVAHIFDFRNKRIERKLQIFPIRKWQAKSSSLGGGTLALKPPEASAWFEPGACAMLNSRRVVLEDYAGQHCLFFAYPCYGVGDSFAAASGAFPSCAWLSPPPQWRRIVLKTYQNRLQFYLNCFQRSFLILDSR